MTQAQTIATIIAASVVACVTVVVALYKILRPPPAPAADGTGMALLAKAVDQLVELGKEQLQALRRIDERLIGAAYEQTGIGKSVTHLESQVQALHGRFDNVVASAQVIE